MQRLNLQNMRSMGVGQSGALQPMFYAPLLSSATLSKGSGSPTFARASKQYYLNASNVLTEYANNTPAFDAVKGLVMEPAGQNLLKWSNVFDAAGSSSVWANTGCTITTDTTLDLSGNVAKKITETAVTSQHVIAQNFTGSVAQHTASILLKAGGRDWVIISSSVGNYAYINLSTYAVGTTSGATATIEHIRDGWCMCTLTYTAAVSAFIYIFTTVSDLGSGTHAGDITKGIYISDAQFETGAIATSRMPSTGTNGSRAASTLSYAASGNIDNTVGTILCDYTPKIVTGTLGIVSSSSGTGLKTSTTSLVLSDGTNTPTGQTLTANATHNIGASWGASGLRVNSNAAAFTTGTFDGNMGFTDILIGNGIHGYIKNVKIYNKQTI